MARLPNLEELEKEFGSVIDDFGVMTVSNWTIENDDEPVDEEKYVEAVERNAVRFLRDLGDEFGEQ